LERCAAGCKELAARYASELPLLRVEPAAVVAEAAAAAEEAALCGESGLAPFVSAIDRYVELQRWVRAVSLDEVHVGALAVRCKRVKEALAGHAQKIVTALLKRVAADTITVRVPSLMWSWA
jgi:hypothetical protein